MAYLTACVRERRVDGTLYIKFRGFEYRPSPDAAPTSLFRPLAPIRTRVIPLANGKIRVSRELHPSQCEFWHRVGPY